MTELLVFIAGASLIIVGALGVVLSKNPVHSALFLIQTLMGVAVLFVLQGAHFLAAVQVVVYAGAIVILFLFVIMLLGVDKAEELGVDPIAGQRPVAAIAGAGLLATGLVIMIGAVDGATGTVQSSGAETALNNSFTDIERIGRVLFSDYVLGFEITAALLTIAVIGAVVLTRTLYSSLLLDELEPGSTESVSLAPHGGNDSDLDAGESDGGH